MKKLAFLSAIVGALVFAAPATADTTSVQITATGFKPDDVVIRLNDTVTWKNVDKKRHQVVSNTGIFASPILKPGESFSFVFARESSYAYHGGLHPRLVGAVHVRTSRPTIGLTRIRAVYGNPIRVFGSIPSGASGELVTISITPYGGPTMTTTVATDEGTWEFTYTPRIRTAFSAEWNGSTSVRQPFVGVRPLVVFEPLNLRRNRFFVRARAARSFAGKVVRIQRMNERGFWVTTKMVKLNRFSQARFTATFPRGTTRARAVVARAPGYEFGFSTLKTITR